jgi:hypothetical protein
MLSVLLASFPTAQINGRRGIAAGQVEGRFVMVVEVSWRVRECLMESGSAIPSSVVVRAQGCSKTPCCLHRGQRSHLRIVRMVIDTIPLRSKFWRGARAKLKGDGRN